MVCTIPWEVIQDVGELNVYVEGIIENTSTTTIATTAIMARMLDIVKSGKVEASSPIDPTPDVYNQIITKLNTLESGQIDEAYIDKAITDYLEEHPIESLTEADVERITTDYINAHRAELKGDKGDKGDKGETGASGIPSLGMMRCSYVWKNS